MDTEDGKFVYLFERTRATEASLLAGEPFSVLAMRIYSEIEPSNARSLALRKLLEAKDVLLHSRMHSER